ncbi:MAG: class I SAM-dependent methyltransferase [Phycisphaerae bacterium]|nr:class I SAM-dependent methyltransferase [Phycisphaerae bacterium]
MNKQDMRTGDQATPRGTDDTCAVRRHFSIQSAQWSTRYSGTPRSMADLDLAMRRECVHRLLWPLLNAAEQSLRVLDVGCGTGDVLDGLPRDLMRVTGVDFVPEMVAVARRTHPSDRFLAADAAALPFTDECADVVTSLGMLEYLPDPTAALAAVFRVLRPGGAFIVSFPNRGSIFRKLLSLERMLDTWVHRLRASSNNPAVNALRSSRYPHRRFSKTEVRQLMTSNGFEIDAMLLHTVGPWGRLGRFRPMLRASRFASHVLRNNRTLSPWLAGTIVVRAKKTCGRQLGRR